MLKLSIVIEYLLRLQEFGKKNYKLPFIVRRAIKKNHEALLSEYKIFKEESDELTEGLADKSNEEKAEIDATIQKMLEVEVKMELETFSVNELSNIDMTLADEELIEFMFNKE